MTRIRTDISRAWSRTEEFAHRARTTYALGRAGEPEEIVGAALYLASPAVPEALPSTASVELGLEEDCDGFPRHLDAIYARRFEAVRRSLCDVAPG